MRVGAREQVCREGYFHKEKEEEEEVTAETVEETSHVPPALLPVPKFPEPLGDLLIIFTTRNSRYLGNTVNEKGQKGLVVTHPVDRKKAGGPFGLKIQTP